MEPHYLQGDHVLTFNWIFNFKKGDVIVFRFDHKLMIKRIESIDGNQLSVSGDNKRMSSEIPKIERSMVFGKVILKY